MDPFLDLIHLLRPRATLWGRTDAVGRWGHYFRKRDDVKFCWVERGSCELVRPQAEPVHLKTDDFILIRTHTPFTVTSDPSVEPVDSETEAADGLLGQGTEFPVTLRGGRFSFDSANEHLLMDLLPSLVHIGSGHTSSWRILSLLKMNLAESSRPGLGSEYIITHLMELILVEILRSVAQKQQPEQTGLLAGLADPLISRALAAMHNDVAHDWTVAELARICSVSRSSFATQFRKAMGTGPIEYLFQWRMALAKDELRRGGRSIGEIALYVGFQSPSAFSKAFTRVVGISPKGFATAN